jgi:cytochrome c oxidase subunit III
VATVSQADEHAHHGPPEANRSSRVDARMLGIYFFIASEIMLFGSFFTVYFFARVVANKGPWPPPPYEDARPVYVALLNTLILVTSSFTMHWALQSVKRNNRSGLIGGLLLTFLLGLTFLLIQAREYTRLGFSPRDLAFGSTFYGLTGLHGMHVFLGLNLLLYALIRAIRGHYSAEPEKHLGVEIPGIYWHFVDVMWIVVYTTVYIF